MLVALVASMTLGTFVLVLLEQRSDPIFTPSDQLAAVAASGDLMGEEVLSTHETIAPDRWRNIVVHSRADVNDPLVAGCHFLVLPGPDGRGLCVRASDRWKRQGDGRHIFLPGGDYNRNTIGVCLIGDFDRREPSGRQFGALVSLIRSLREQLGVPADRVYLARYLDLRHRSPGDAFPTERFEYLVRAPLD